LPEVTAFIANYSSSDESRIRFDWNGKHAADFVDRNMEFRESVREAVLEDVSSAPLELVRDIFRAETRCSKEAWCIVKGVGVLAEALLRRGGTLYLDDYLEGKFQSFDASLGSAFKVDLPLAHAMLCAVRQRIQSMPGSAMIDLWRAGEELFLGWIEGFKPENT